LTPAPLVGSALLTSFACLPLMLPRQREALGRLFGRSLGGGVVGAAAPEPTLAFRAVSMAVITALVLILPIGGVIGYVERQISSVINKGARPPHRSPALVNAHDEMKTLFTKGTSKNISENEAPENTILGYPNTIPNSFAGCVLPAFYTPEVGEMAIRKTPPEALTAYFKFLAPYIETIEKVKESDYCDFSGGSIPNFINLRATSRALAFRSIVRLSEGKPEDAARDIDTVFRLGTVLQTDGTIVQYMVGTAIVGIGTQAAYEYFLWNRNQPEKLAILIRAMERSAPRIHQSFDFERIRRTEPGWWPIALYPELSVPGYFRAHDGYYCKWLEFDFVLVAMKLELYRNANGAYPDSLGQLVPEYLDRVPLDPSDGKPWIYKNLGTEFELSSAMNEQLGADRGFPKQFKLPFPVSEVDTPEARETIEKWIPGAPVEKNPKIPQAKGKKAK
ncbi:hypothetical protein HY256_07185, partial [Candidatus Sumerlaeota bacterium]|nr:hypothetical protein [Candidatus Sumerlaeota bacterium]